jgi:hypothetical protein
MGRYLALGSALTAVAVAATGSTHAQSQPASSRTTVTLTAGLVASIANVGRSKGSNDVTIAMQLENTGKLPIAIAMIGPAPVATDNAGTSYQYATFSGAAACRYLTVDYVAMCILGEETSGSRYPVPLQAFTQIDPGTTASLTFGLNGQKGTGTLLSFASVFAYRVIADPRKDETLSETERRKQIRTLNISFPSFPIATSIP